MLNKKELQIVQNCALFHDVDEFIVEQLVNDHRCRISDYRKNDIIFSSEIYERSLGILLSGKIRVEKPGNALLISTLRAGDCFGAAAMFHQGAYVNLLTALSDVRILFISQELLEWIMHRDFKITKNYVAYLSERIIFLNQRLEILSESSGEKKIARYLLQHQTIQCSMTELCARINVGRATLYRVLEQMEALEAIQRGKKSIILVNQEPLKQILEEST